MSSKKKNTSWGKVASWYDSVVEKEGSYQKDLILPNLLRLMAIKEGEYVADVACGQGFFARALVDAGAHVIASDVSKELIELAKKVKKNAIEYHVSSADDLSFIQARSVDSAVIILALQNIKNMDGVLRECSRILRDEGSLFIVLNHPAFRIPKASSWGWDEEKKVQYRRVDAYLSESQQSIDMHPGQKKTSSTISFHRPLQVYMKSLSKNGFCIARLEEWNSHKKSEPGPRAKAEDIARKEIPLFLCFEAKKRSSTADRTLGA